MNVLPDTIAILDADLRQVRRLPRVDGAGHAEADFDRLIADHADIIAGALVSAGMVERGCTLRVLAQKHQVAGIDVLLAEVDGDDLLRLVLVETKLFKNPEAHRTALAQILEYANTLQFDVDVSEILSKVDEPTTRAWLEARTEDLERIKSRGDFLLLICGDRIQPRLAEIAKPMLDRRDHVLSGIELALVSLALYEGEGTTVLVPNLVGAVVRGERDLRIEVTVRTDDGKIVPAKVAVLEREEDARATPARPPPVNWTEKSFFDKVEDPDVKRGLGELLRFVDGTENLSVTWGKGAKYPTFAIMVGPTARTKVAWGDTGAWVWVSRAQLAKVIGDARATKRVKELAKRLGIEVSMSDPQCTCLGTDDRRFEVGDRGQFKIFTQWLVEMRDEILAAQTGNRST